MLTKSYNIDTTFGMIRKSDDQLLATGELRGFRGDRFILLLSMRKFTSAGFVPYVLPSGSELFFGLKKTTDLNAVAFLAWSDADQWDIEGDGAIPASGIHSVRIDLRESALAALCTTAVRTLDLVGEIEINEPGVGVATLAQFDFRIVNDVSKGIEGLTSETAPSYYTSAQIDALLAAKFSIPAGFRLVVNADGSTELEVIS